MKKLIEDYPNVAKNMSKEWFKRFEKSENEIEVERLFDYLEDKYAEYSKKLDPLLEDLELKVDVISRNWENFIQVSLEKIVYNHEYDAWEYTEEYLITIEVRIEDWYKNNDEKRTQEKLEDFLARLPEPVELALI